MLSDFLAVLRPLHSAANATFNFGELWYCVPDSFEQNFIGVQDISLAATGSGNGIPAGQNVFTFRTREGGSMRINLMEAPRNYGTKVSYTSMTTAEKDFCDFVTDNVNEGWFLGQDTSYPFATIALYPGQNEALFKKRYRPN